MTTPELTPEAVEALAQVILGAYHRGEWDDCMNAARVVLAAGYVDPQTAAEWAATIDAQGREWQALSGQMRAENERLRAQVAEAEAKIARQRSVLAAAERSATSTGTTGRDVKAAMDAAWEHR
ncbi:hypothetical protein ACIRON_02870 [Nocardioides sp. NPDC101246]|uniref:hypothetical protein n=1 Tax=Nocardioides sp. NPDC101246 TaxID=3364336 RepID=UPI00381D950C